MGILVDGEWHDVWYDTESTDGRFIRPESGFRNWITPDGRPGPTGRDGFSADAGRYHLYVSLACPWAHRTLIFRELKQLHDIISVSVVNALMGADGWTFKPGPGVVADDINHVQCLHELYTLADPEYSGRATVPVLWDKQQNSIVSNESAEIIRMFNNAFDGLGAAAGDYYPRESRPEIDEVNDYVYKNINNGVYRAGFATTQEAYDEAVEDVFAALDRLESRLGASRYLLGNYLTEADWRLFTTLARFDPVYVGHFKCNRKQLREFPNLSGYVRDLYQVPGIAETVNISYIKHHYYGSHTAINPTGIVPIGPDVDYEAPHERALLV